MRQRRSSAWVLAQPARVALSAPQSVSRRQLAPARALVEAPMPGSARRALGSAAPAPRQANRL